MKSGHGCFEPEAHAPGVRRLDRGDPVLEAAREDAAVPLEGELHVLGGDRLAVVEFHAAAQHEVVDEPVRRDGPRLGQAGARGLPGIGFTTPSWSAYSTMNDVMIVVSAGSK